MTIHQMSLSYTLNAPKPRPVRQSILQLQESVGALPDQIECDELNTHHFAPGMYGREMFIPAGTVIVGKIHKHAHINVILTGLIKVVTEFGEDLYRGPRIWISEPGTKRAVYALEDTQWLCVHPNPGDTRDLEELENYVIAKDYNNLDKFLLEQE